MSVRAKFRCVEVHRQYAGQETTPVTRVKLQAVTASEAGENAIFGKATPFGNVEMGLQTEEAADQFEVGSVYYLDFTLASE